MTKTSSHAIAEPTPTPTPGETEPLAERQKHQLKYKAKYVDVDEIHDASGLFAIICQKASNGCFTFAIFKGFTRDYGEHAERTSFVPVELADAYAQLVRLAKERIEAIRKAGTAPFPERR